MRPGPTMKRFIRAKVDALLAPVLERTYDVQALALLKPLEGGYLPWTRSAMRPSAVCCILNDIVINRRRTVVEFGAGISTLFMARILAQCGGSLVSFEQDANWCRTVQQMLRDAQLGAAFEVVHAPLKPCAHALHGAPWYDAEVVDSMLEGRSIDLAVVDGPTAFQPGMASARFPALQALKPRLADAFSIVLDDIGRAGEAEISRRWEAELGLKGDTYRLEGNFGVITRGDAYNFVL